MFFDKRSKVPPYEYNPEKEKPVIRSSICTGEKVAGFKDLETGKFHEVLLIRSEKDIAAFKKNYNIDAIETEY